ncbi:MAG: transcription antitermination factor NusB [Bacteroides sp.]|nr:transcription antitermination factor NusB [Bacteroides sp.]
MMGRHELREQTFRLLFRAEFHSAPDMEEQMALFREDIPAEDAGHTVNEEEAAYITARCGKIQEKLSEIDRIIDDNAEGWDTSRMGKAELTVLRLGVYEILFDDDIPDSVAIDEAVEIAKKYGQKASGGFVNAILAKVWKSGENNL